MNETLNQTPRSVVLEKCTRPHSYFYPIAVLAFNRAKNEKDETISFLDRVVAATFCAFTIEGYLNWLGSERLDQWERFERISPEQKLLVLGYALSFKPDLSMSPFDSFKKIFSFRNKCVAHGKPESVRTTYRHGSEPIHPMPTIESTCSVEVLERWIADTKTMIEITHKLAGYSDEPLGTMSVTKVSILTDNE